MSGGDWFVAVIALLNLGAVVCYLRARDWPYALMCFGALLINSAVIWKNLK